MPAAARSARRTRSIQPSAPARATEPKARDPGRQAAPAVLVGTAATASDLWKQLKAIGDTAGVVGLVLVGDAEATPLPGTPPVLGTVADLAEVRSRHGVTSAIVSLPGTMGDARGKIASALRALGIAARVVPPLREALARPAARGAPGLPGSEGIAAGMPKIDPAELTGRAPYGMDRRSVARVLGGQRVLITGAGGSIGSELSLLAAAFGPEELVLMERAENALFDIDRRVGRRFPGVARRAVLHDVTDADETLRLLVRLKPGVVFHAAAHKHVPLMEDHPAHAVVNNVFGTRSIADAARAVGVTRFVMISSDKAVNPTSVMGATKRLAERYVQWLHRGGNGSPGGGATRYSMVRFGNVLGSACSVLPIWGAQIAEGGPVTVTDPRMTRWFMSTDEAVRLVLQAAATSDDHAVLALQMGEQVNVYELAERMIRLVGRRPGIDIEIAITGMRPGEKLSEDLVGPGETASGSGPIIGINPVVMSRSRLDQALAELSSIADALDDEAARRALLDLALSAHETSKPGSTRRAGSG